MPPGVPRVRFGAACVGEERGGVRRKLRQEAARLEQLAEQCEELAGKAPLAPSDREELLEAGRACRQLAAELKSAAEPAN